MKARQNDELLKSIGVLLENLLNLRKNERLLIIGDTGSDQEVIKTTVIAGKKIGGAVSTYISPFLRVMQEEPHLELAHAMEHEDVIIDFSENHLSYSDAWRNAIKNGARGYCITNLSPEAVIRCIGKVDINEIAPLGDSLARRTRNASIVRITSELGTDLTMRMNVFGTTLSSLLSRRFNITFNWVGKPTGLCLQPGQSTYLSGQVLFIGIKRSVNGVLAIDGSIYPPKEIGLLKSPVFLKIKSGKIVEISDGREAIIFKEWLESFNKSSMFEIKHFSYGFNPGAKLSSYMIEAERVYGCIVAGFGSWPFHTDGVILKPTVKIDKDYILESGNYRIP